MPRDLLPESGVEATAVSLRIPADLTRCDCAVL